MISIIHVMEKRGHSIQQHELQTILSLSKPINYDILHLLILKQYHVILSSDSSLDLYEINIVMLLIFLGKMLRHGHLQKIVHEYEQEVAFRDQSREPLCQILPIPIELL